MLLLPGLKRSQARQAPILVIALIFSGCSIQHLAIQSLTEVFENSFESLNEESDLLLAEQAIMSNLKTLEGVVRTEPDNTRLLFLLTRAYSGYALGFVEDTDRSRAREMYRRGKDYGVRILRLNRTFGKALNGPLLDFERTLQTLDKEELPAVFWTALGWGNYINLSRGDPEALADMPKVLAMMRFVLSHDENYYYGGVHMFFGSWYGSRPGLLGGDQDSSKYHFERCLEIGEGKFLLPYVYYAYHYAVQIQDRGLYQQLLTKVLDSSSDVLPKEQLTNAIAKRKAETYLNRIAEYF